MLLIRNTSQRSGHRNIESKVIKKRCIMQILTKKARVIILLSDKVDFKEEIIGRDRLFYKNK